MTRARLLVVLAGLVSTACVDHPRLPDDWRPPPSLAGNACPDISGLYKMTFECSEGAATHQPAALLGKRPGKEASQLSIARRDADSIVVAALADGNILFSRTLSGKSGDFTCEGGWIRIASSDGGLSAGTMVAVVGGGWQTDAYARSGDYLLVESAGSGMGLAIVPIPFPFAYSLSSWCRSPLQKGPADAERGAAH